jgi:hypothetical protein
VNRTTPAPISSQLQPDLLDIPLPRTLILANWLKALAFYPQRHIAELAIHDIKFGADVLYHGPLANRNSHNLPSAIDHPEAVDEHLRKETAAGRIFGPTESRPANPFIVSPIGSVPKKDSDEWRIIHHLSWPVNNSVNDWIHDQPLSYTTFDNAIALVRKLGVGCFLSKVDVKSAFRTIAVNKRCRFLLGMRWRGKFYADLSLPFGMKSSPGIWERFATLAEWVVRGNGVEAILHYVDDYLIGGRSAAECQAALDTVVKVFQYLGIPINPSKFAAEGLPLTRIRFLGIIIDTVAMVAQLDDDRLRDIRAKLESWTQRQNCSVPELRSLIGTLSFAAKVVPAGRTFIRRLLITLTAALSRASTTTVNLTREFRCDIAWWQKFIATWNGVAILPDPFWSSPPAAIAPDAPVDHLFTDACLTGFGAVFGPHWLAEKWTASILQTAQRNSAVSMPYLELYAVAAAVATWGKSLRGRKLLVHSDSATAVAVMAGATSPDHSLMDLVRSILFVAATHEFAIRLAHISGVDNACADALSRGQIEKFRSRYAKHDSFPTAVLPPPLHAW